MARGYQYKDAAFVPAVDVGRGGNIDIRGFFTPTGIHCRPDDVAARLHTECAGWNEKDPLKRFTDENRMKVLDEVIDRGVHICTKQGSDEVIRATQRRRRLLGLS